MSSSVTLSAGVRSNLLALQDTTSLQSITQQRLATGKKVNSALDNPTNFFTAAALSARAGELTNLLNSMTNGINTLKAADNGLTSITTTIQSMQASVTQARQDASWQSSSYTIDSTTIGTTALKTIGFSAGAVGSTPVTVNLNDQEKVTRRLHGGDQQGQPGRQPDHPGGRHQRRNCGHRGGQHQRHRLDHRSQHQRGGRLLPGIRVYRHHHAAGCGPERDHARRQHRWHDPLGRRLRGHDLDGYGRRGRDRRPDRGGDQRQQPRSRARSRRPTTPVSCRSPTSRPAP